jgi:hypothetical protein
MRIIAALIFWLCGSVAFAAEAGWRPWTADVFQEAKAQNRLVILDLEAVWCHWCHVMRETTYRDAEVLKLLNEHFIAVRADQDANPDLSNRYGDWGWPATILFAPDGGEIAKIRGYRDPAQMRAILAAFVKDPTPGPSIVDEAAVVPAARSFLTKAQRDRLIANWREVYDRENGGWGDVQKFIHTESMDLALARAELGDDEAEQMARQTLDRALKLIDPVWGGIYQYSDKADWSSPHYEKIMWYQAQGARQYALAYRLFGEERYLDAATRIAGYMTQFLLGPEGAFHVSQDADLSREVPGRVYYALFDAERRKLGMPRVDTNLYARENGWAISALVAFSNATGDKAALQRARTAARWVLANRSLGGGGFAHGLKDRGGPFLADTLAMGQAALDLYAATGEREWLKTAEGAGDFIAATFASEAGYATAAKGEAASGPLAKPFVQVEENIQLARFFNMLNRYLGARRFRDHAEAAMRYLASEQVTSMRRFLAGVVLADDELAIEPTHITIVGHRDDPRAQALHDAARAYPALYKRLDWWDTREGPLPNPDVQYPEMDEPAAFACSNQICSRPAFDADTLAKTIKQMNALRTAKRE